VMKKTLQLLQNAQSEMSLAFVIRNGAGAFSNLVLRMQDLDLFHPVRMLFGDVYLVFRVLFVATMTPVSAMLIANAKGVQVRNCKEKV
jgi:hypothetical protein